MMRLSRTRKAGKRCRMSSDGFRWSFRLSDHLEPAAATTVCYILSPANLERDLELLRCFLPTFGNLLVPASFRKLGTWPSNHQDIANSKSEGPSFSERKSSPRVQDLGARQAALRERGHVMSSVRELPRKGERLNPIEPPENI